ncbi:unnamed protein product, partial [Symbiodinium microadriaticum]
IGLDLSAAEEPKDEKVAELLARSGVTGDSADLSDEGLQMVLALQSEVELRSFLLRILGKDWRQVKTDDASQQELVSFAKGVSGGASAASFSSLREQLRSLSQETGGSVLSAAYLAPRLPSFPALEVLRCMGEARLLPNAPRCCAVQARCDRAGRWKASGLFLERMAVASIELGVIAYGTAANGCRAQGLWPRALALLRELGIFGCEVSDIAINTGLASCSYGYAWEQALHLLGLLEAKDPKQSTTAANTAAKACESQLRWDLVLELLAPLMARSKVDVFSCSTSLSACGRGSRWQAALLLWQGYERLGVPLNKVAYGALCSALNLGRPELCGGLLEEMRRKQLQPNLIICNVALSSFLELDLWPASLQLLAEMDASGPTPNIVSLRTAAAAVVQIGTDARPLLGRLGLAVLRLLQQETWTPLPDRPRFSSFVPLTSSLEATEVILEHGADGMLAVAVGRALDRALAPGRKALLRLVEDAAAVEEVDSLESLFGLGAEGTQAMLQALGMASASWEPVARLRSRRAHLNLPAARRPTAQTTLAWRALCLKVSNAQIGRAGSAVRYGAVSGVASLLLRPIRVEHDRALHPERRALATILAELIAARGGSFPWVELKLGPGEDRLKVAVAMENEDTSEFVGGGGG